MRITLNKKTLAEQLPRHAVRAEASQLAVHDHEADRIDVRRMLD
jgi:hypothetical protein